MKILIYVILALASALFIFNVAQVDFADPFTGKSEIAVISCLACGCAILLLIILIMSRRIAEKKMDRSPQKKTRL
ncbi:MAG: hypothetical protein CL868_02650 [Cytophagaceae bacterium]|nr:hypothetical protein [Cytophagaceae bacterium]|tara:strand:- start:17596 stop:17820 length:225 start_codon:yes stop_codon:yes gene_type:complete